jgi:ADP-heptose:LPS heptosyltransferase
MRILVGKTFGIGNAVLAVPLIKSLMQFGYVDVLVGSTQDDYGAVDVMRLFQETWPSPGRYVNKIFVDSVPDSEDPYDVAIMAIPFDGRWKNGIHFRANRVLDCRRRPGDVDRLGFDMWKKHEVEYQMENSRELGYEEETPDCSFLSKIPSDPDLVYVGLGYKRDAGGFGKSKHYGNDNYADLLSEIKRIRPSVKFVSTGTVGDLVQSWAQIVKRLDSTEYYRFPMLDLKFSFRELAGCGAYIGNDTGMMHVAASLDIPTFGLFAYPDLLVKNPPFCSRQRAVMFQPPKEAAQMFVDFVWRT